MSMHVTMVNAPLLPVPPVLGGPIEHTLYETALAIKRPKMSVISLGDQACQKRFDDLPKGVFHHVDLVAQRKRVQRILGKRGRRFFQNRAEARLFYYVNGVTDLLLDLKSDVIQVHNDVDVMAYLCKQFSQDMKVLYLHNEPRYACAQTVECAQRCDRFVFVSNFLKQKFCERFPDCADRSTVIYNGIDTGAFSPAIKANKETRQLRKRLKVHHGQTILFVGRTVRVKGLHCVLNAMPEVLRNIPDAKLMVVGSPLFGAVSDAQYLHQMKKKARSLGSAVAFTGFVASEKIPYYYAIADVVVVPSLWGEPFGKVVVEAMASGVPVVGSERGAIPELLDVSAGMLIKRVKDSSALANALVRLLKSEERRIVMGDKARERAVAQFSSGVRFGHLRSFYKMLREEL